MSSKNKHKEKDLICSECGSIYPFKQFKKIDKIKGFKYAYCFKCGMMTRHQTIDPIDLYKCELCSKEEDELTTKDKIVIKALKLKI